MRSFRSLAILAASLGLAAPLSARAGEGDVLLAPLTNEEAWKAMPPAETGGGRPLPSWARMLARSLPKTTAALLELDYAQRAKNPLDPKLRAAMRLVAAHANGCDYAEAYAAADATRAGLGVEAVKGLASGDFSAFNDDEKAALTFARKITLESSKVTDEEFAALVKAYGEKKAAAMVLTMAYANFQDRFLIVLGAPIEDDGPMPPLEVSFRRDALAARGAPPAPPAISDLPKPTGKDLIEDDGAWTALSYEELQRKLEAQRKKPTRLRIPTADEVMKGLPPGATFEGRRVVWTLVAFGYVPELAAPWENLMWTNGIENGRRFDRAFGLGLFWIVTRTIDCPYCMGHVEMNWEVIGMKPKQIAERSRALAGADWSSFPPEEQRAFALARKITATPASVTRADVAGTVKDFGLDAAVSLLTYVCRCNYMVRVSNGFQLSLERDNVFFDYYKVKPQAAETDAQRK